MITDNTVKTNIVYFNNYCNLACTYCYETLDAVKKVTTSKEELKKIADDTIAREPKDKQTFFELFGGEPTLSWDNVVYFMDYCYSIKQNIHFEMVTNGIKLIDDRFMFQVYNNSHIKDGRLSISISYDGLEGNVDRIYQDKRESTIDVVSVLSKLSVLEFPFRIRYTIHKKNLYHVVEDITSILKHFKPLRIITSEVTEQLDDEDKHKVQRIYNLLREKWNNNEITVPICDVFCDTCDGCTIRRDNLHYFVGDKEFQKQSYDEVAFNHFEKEIK